MSRVSYVMMNPGGAKEMTEGGARGAQRAGRRGRARGQASPRSDILEVDVRRQPDHASPAARHRPDRARRRALRAGHRRARSRCWATRDRTSSSTATRASTCCPASPAMSAPMPPASMLSEGPTCHDEMTLLVDVGTNAEIVLGNRERLLACSSPTGPAFEGAQISCGQRAAPGAIERVRIDPRHAGAALQGHRLATCGRTSRASRRRRRAPASPASAARASSR